jgi:hypothetical protein
MQSYETSAAVNHLLLSFVLQQGVVPKPSWCALHLLPPITMTHYKRTQTKGNTKQKNPLRDNQSKLSSKDEFTIAQQLSSLMSSVNFDPSKAVWGCDRTGRNSKGKLTRYFCSYSFHLLRPTKVFGQSFPGALQIPLLPHSKLVYYKQSSTACWHTQQYVSLRRYVENEQPCPQWVDEDENRTGSRNTNSSSRSTKTSLRRYT